MSLKIHNPEYPYSVERLVRLCRTWDFHDDLYGLDDDETGEPLIWRAHRRVNEAMSKWRDTHSPGEGPIFDETLASFHVCDVALLVAEFERLIRLEEKIIRALGPPTKQHRFDKKLERFVPDENDDEDYARND